ncbi:MAG TPA: hypothetical protein VGA13_01305 [Acidimicrobiales bacterium]
MTNDKVYIHELIDVRGHNRAKYMHHMTANWSPLAQETRHQLCYGVWATLGSTGRWPQVVNIWEEDGFDGLAASFAEEAVGQGAQDPALERWWAHAAELRSGGFDRLLRPAPWTRTIEELSADGVSGACYAHELVSVQPGSDRDFLELVRDHAISAYQTHRWELVGAWTTAMVNDDECLLLWVIPTWEHWASLENAEHDDDDGLVKWRQLSTEVVTGRHRTILVDAPLSPFRTGRQPNRDDRTDWVD